MTAQQTIDTGISRHTLERQLVSAGYWGTSELRKRNAYVLSPSAYALSASQYAQLRKLSECAYRALTVLSARLSELASRTSLSNEEAAFLKLATSHTSGLCSPRDIRGAVPPAIKIDLVQDENGGFRIAEIDAYNPRGFAYLGLLDGTLPPGFRSAGEGIAGLARLMRFVARNEEDQWLFLVATHEHYYLPTFEILTDLLAKCGMSSLVVREGNLSSESFAALRNGACLHVFCIPQSFQNAEVRQRLLDRRIWGGLRTFYPPAAYLGSKAFLPFLAHCSDAYHFIAKSYLVSKRHDPRAELDGKQMVLKGVMSSGAKHIVFSDTAPARFEEAYAQARSTKQPLWVLQEKVVQEPVPIVVFDDAGGRAKREHFLRITAYASANGLLGAEVTGRTCELVHGAPDCIQIPVVLGE